MGIRSAIIHLLGGKTKEECTFIKSVLTEKPIFQSEERKIQKIVSAYRLSQFARELPEDLIKKDLAYELTKKMIDGEVIEYEMKDETDEYPPEIRATVYVAVKR